MNCGGRTKLVHGCGQFLYRSGGADLLSHPGAHGGLDARLGASLFPGTDVTASNDHHHVGAESSSPHIAFPSGTRVQSLPGSMPGND